MPHVAFVVPADCAGGGRSGRRARLHLRAEAGAMMVNRHPRARPIAWLAAGFAATLAASGSARAADNPGLGVAMAGGLFIGALGAASPYLIGIDRRAPGPATASMIIGAGGHLDAYAIGMDFGGYWRSGGGWMGRSRFELTAAREGPA